MSEPNDDTGFTDFLRGRDTPEAQDLLRAHPMMGLARLALLWRVARAGAEDGSGSSDATAGRFNADTLADSIPVVYSRAASSSPRTFHPDSSWTVHSFQIERSDPAGAPIGVSVSLVTRPESDDVFVQLKGYTEGTRFVAWIPSSPDDMPVPPREAIMQRPTASGLVPLYLPEGVRPELALDLRLALYLGSDLNPTTTLWLSRGE